MTVCCAGWNEPCIAGSHPYRITSTKCHINTVVSPDDGHSRPKHAEKRNKHTKKNCTPSWLYLQDYPELHSQQNIKKLGVYNEFYFIKCVEWLMC
jgi:hypothetical protein